MDRLTIKSKCLIGEHYGLKSMNDDNYSPYGAAPREISCNDYCNITEAGACLKCGIQAAFDKLAAYENTGLSPEAVRKILNVLQEAQNDTFS